MKNLLFLLIPLLLFHCTEEKIAPNTPKLGMSYLDGKIAYIYAPMDVGYVKDEIHGLILSEDFGLAIWGCISVDYTKFSQSGKDNTSLIIDICNSNSAAYKCYINGWWLPSSQEWQLITKSGILLHDAQYWTSSKYSSSYAIAVNPIIGKYTNEPLSKTFKVIGLKQF